MKNIIVYYMAIMWLSKNDAINPAQFLGLLVFYVFIYRTYIDGKRLADKNIIPKKDIWKMIIPEKRFDYFKELYIKK